MSLAGFLLGLLLLPPAAKAVGAPPPGPANSWDTVFEARRDWWSFKPVKKPSVPLVKDAAWSGHPMDRFLLARMEQRGLGPAAPAGRRMLIRRLSLALIGLPPTPGEVRAFVEDNSPDAYARVVDRLMASPRFGERWARHWMDLVRFAETHGSEGDPEIPGAWRYRDYLIRAFNGDVPCDQLIREHLAGDLLPVPRVNLAEDINESMLGLAHLRLVEHGFQSVDTLDEQVKTVDSQIDVLSKAFQGLTTSCARCHDHKFDPISQRDYYSLYGILASSRPTQVTIDLPGRLRVHRAELEQLKFTTRVRLAEAWARSARELPGRLHSMSRVGGTNCPERDAGRVRWLAAFEGAIRQEGHPLELWEQFRGIAVDAMDRRWETVVKTHDKDLADRKRYDAETFRVWWPMPIGLAADATASLPSAWDVRPAIRAPLTPWFRLGVNPPESTTRPGEFALEPDGARILSGLLPSGVFSHLLSQKHNGVFVSPRFAVESDSISVRVVGGKGGRVRLIPDNYPIGQGNIFPQAVLTTDAPTWVRLDTAYRKGSQSYLEFATAGEVTSRDRSPPGPGGRSFFGVMNVVFHDGKTLPKAVQTPLTALLPGPAPRTVDELEARLGRCLAEAVEAWRKDSLTDEQFALLDSFVRPGLLPVTLEELPTVAPVVRDYRRIEDEIPVPRRAPGVMETSAYDAPLLARGDHLHPLETVPRGYLRLVARGAYETRGSGRLELALDLASERNPLTARVMVNRVWHHLFGRGLVATVDNFGRLGDRPSHPELLDFLAAHFVENHWSFKELIRYIVTSQAWQLSDGAPSGAREADPANELLTHARVRRLEAEVIRDTLLAISGRLDATRFGPGADALAAPTEQRRRSVYLTIRRNFPSPFLEAFDAPKPFSTLGRRDATNVPGQSLALLNDPFVMEQAGGWARSVILAESDPDARIRRMFEMAFSRPPAGGELLASRAYIADLSRAHGADQEQAVWRDFAQSLFNLKEFIYVR